FLVSLCVPVHYLLRLCRATSPLFPYTTLFRSPALPDPVGAVRLVLDPRGARARRRRGRAQPRGGSAAARLPELPAGVGGVPSGRDRKSTRLNSSHVSISYAVFSLKKKDKQNRN